MLGEDTGKSTLHDKVINVAMRRAALSLLPILGTSVPPLMEKLSLYEADHPVGLRLAVPSK